MASTSVDEVRAAVERIAADLDADPSSEGMVCAKADARILVEIARAAIAKETADPLAILTSDERSAFLRRLREMTPAPDPSPEPPTLPGVRPIDPRWRRDDHGGMCACPSCVPSTMMIGADPASALAPLTESPVFRAITRVAVNRVDDDDRGR